MASLPCGPAMFDDDAFRAALPPDEEAAFTYPAYRSVSRDDTALPHFFSPERDDFTGMLLRIRCPAGAPRLRGLHVWDLNYEP
ncbi:hypothetical protein ACM64Y_13335 [Novispirillum sp. DQ9]|uniref:hypothetical protein n=1 Tax=Novispirillum sp. DQ9 TaxID=3398612 RepID=UPI003C7C340C